MSDLATRAVFATQPLHATIRSTSPVENLRAALELHEVGVALMRQNLRRRHPDEPDDAIEERLADWLRSRPGAEHGDAAGRPSNRTVL